MTYRALQAVAVLVSLTCSLQAQNNDAAGLPIVSGNLTISDAVATAIKYSPTLQGRNAEVSAASARVGAAKSMTRPQLSATTLATTGNMPMIIAGPESVQPQNFNLLPGAARIDQNFMLMYPLYTGGRLRGEVHSAEALKTGAAWDTASSALDVALAAKIAFYKVLVTRTYVQSYQKRVDESTERVRIAEDTYKQGRIAKYDLLRNQTDLAESQQMLIDAQKDVDVAMADLKNAMGVSQGSNPALVGTLTCQDFGQDVTKLEPLAIAQRPEVAAARARLKSAQSAVSAAKGSYKPQIYFTGMQDFSGTQNGGSGAGYTLGIAAGIPIFDGGSRKSSIEEARASVEQMKAQEREAILTVARDVAAQIAELSAETKKVALAQAAVDQADEGYRVIKLRYESGKATNVEVLDALASLTRAQTNYSEALYRHNVARERLVRAIGQNN